mgnify:CR=1 FL=1
MNQSQEKENAALAALDYIQHECILGVGSGSTVTSLIQNLNEVKPVSYTHLTLPTNREV